MKIKRYLVLVTVLVGMGLSTVWWKSRTLAMGYETVRQQRQLDRLIEEESLEDSLLAGLTAPSKVRARAEKLGLSMTGNRSNPRKAGGRRGGSSRRPAKVASR
jgi:hypothetical protein